MAKKLKKSNNKLLIILSGIAGVLVLFAVIGKSQGWVGKKKEIEVEVTNAAFKTIIEKVSASGMVQPVIEVKISPEVPGEIIELNIKEGDSVKLNDFLLKIRPNNFVSALERSNANLNQQMANLAASKSNLARAEAGYYRSRLEYDRQEQLHIEKVISNADFELAEANYKISMQDLESAKQSVQAGVYIVKSAQASVDEAEKNLKLTNIRAPMTGIVSKLDVEKGETVVGTSQMQGTEMLRIADLSNMEVRVDVNENDIIRISIGDTALIDVDSYSYMKKEFKGVVTQIANSAKAKASSDAITEFEVRIKILNESYQDLLKEMHIIYPFRPGMTASVDIITEINDNTLSVPLSAVTTRSKDDEKGSEFSKSDEDDAEFIEDAEELAEEENGNGSSANGYGFIKEDELEEVVFVMREGKAVKVVVFTGISDFESIQIKSGLTADDQIISGPFLAVSKRLKNGVSVVIKEEKANDKEADEFNE